MKINKIDTFFVVELGVQIVREAVVNPLRVVGIFFSL